MSKRTVLIVEGPGPDHPSGRYRALARRGGFKVLSSNSGSMTKAVLRRSQPDLVMLSPDIAPPGPSEIARSIKDDPMTHDIPVLMLIGKKPQLAPVYSTEGSARIDATDDELLSTMRLLTAKTRRLRYEPKPRGPLEGALGDDHLPDVLQFLFASRKTGRVTIANGARRPGRIYIEAGNVVHAEYADQDGMTAFRKLCFSTHGRFRFEPDERTAMAEDPTVTVIRKVEARSRRSRTTTTNPMSPLRGCGDSSRSSLASDRREANAPSGRIPSLSRFYGSLVRSKDEARTTRRRSLLARGGGE